MTPMILGRITRFADDGFWLPVVRQKLLQNCDAANQIVVRAISSLNLGDVFEPDQGHGSNALGLRFGKLNFPRKAQPIQMDQYAQRAFRERGRKLDVDKPRLKACWR